MKRILLTTAAMSLAIMVAGTANAASAFTTEQKIELNNMIGEYLMANPNKVIAALEKYQNDQMAAQMAEAAKNLKANKKALERDKKSPVIGNKKGDFVIVEFFDYNCGYCKRMFPEVMKFVEKDGNVKWVMKELPTLSDTSRYAAKAALAAARQGKYTEMHTAFMTHKGVLSEEVVMNLAKAAGLDIEKLKKDMESEKTEKILASNLELASKIGVSGIPAFVVGGEFKPGAFDATELPAIAAKVRAENAAAKKKK